jgi:hypothetical protein
MRPRHPLYVAPAATLAAVAVFAGGFWAGQATADTGGPAAPAAQPFPDWFLPIWDAYDRNPAVTPAFEFASLYSGQVAGD